MKYYPTINGQSVVPSNRITTPCPPDMRVELARCRVCERKRCDPKKENPICLECRLLCEETLERLDALIAEDENSEDQRSYTHLQGME